MSQNENNRYTIMKYQLQYFYLINVDQLVDSITNKIKGKDLDASNLLELIFEQVFTAITGKDSGYGDILNINSYHILFNEDRTNKQIRGLFQLMYLTLQNNCILNSFFHELAFKSQLITITGKHVPLITKDIINMILNDTHRKNIPGEVDSQFFDRRKNIYKSDKNTYHATILNTMNTANGQHDGNLPINVLQYLSPLANFMFIEDKCAKFCRSLNNEKDIITKYNNLWNTFEEQKKNYAPNIDKLIFESEINSVFGFSFFPSILKCVAEIYNSSLSDKKNFKDLEGQPFNEIILQAANLPLFNNKEIFLKYVCYAFINSPSIDYSYFEESAKAFMIRNIQPQAKQQQVLNGLDLMRKFFLILDYITIPLLYSLWEIVIDELNRKNSAILVNTNTYISYLSDNYASFNYSYFNFSEELLNDWGRNSLLSADFHLSNHDLVKFIPNNPTIDTEKPEKEVTNSKNKYILSPYSPKVPLETTGKLIKSYCNIQALKKRVPFFFLSKDEIQNYSPLSNFIEFLLTDNPHYTGATPRVAEEAFFISHRKAIYEFLFSKN